MEPIRVGIREFRDHLASYLLESESPVAITRHGDTVGFYIPARRRRSDSERAALDEAAAHMRAILKEKGLSEGDVLGDYRELRRRRRQK